MAYSLQHYSTPNNEVRAVSHCILLRFGLQILLNNKNPRMNSRVSFRLPVEDSLDVGKCRKEKKKNNKEKSDKVNGSLCARRYISERDHLDEEYRDMAS